MRIRFINFTGLCFIECIETYFSISTQYGKISKKIIKNEHYFINWNAECKKKGLNEDMSKGKF